MSNAQTKAGKNRFILLEKEALLGLLINGRTAIEKFGTLQPMLFSELSNGERIMCPLRLPDESSEQYQKFNTLGKQIRSQCGSIETAVAMLEIWIVYGNEAPDIKKYRPSQHPCRREAIVLVGRNADKTRLVIVIQTFTRDEHNAPVWSKPKTVISDSGDGGMVAEGLIDALFDDQTPN